MTGGEFGECPAWYPCVRASRYLGGGVAPWEWEHAPAEWLHRVLAAERAEIGARKPAH